MRKLLLACAAVALLGCGGSDSSGPAPSAEGTWNLLTVNGSPLPVTVQQTSTTKIEVTADQYILASDNTYTETFSTRTTQGTTVTTSDDPFDGTWSQGGNQVHITDSDGATLTGTINGSGDQITISVGQFLLVYAKE
ncbi:MAG TPA: lipocalin family protein [Gemmatimonadaceae bacterium]|nr:lipocalin family protein [Gemmatimonadaceae bacterium]